MTASQSEKGASEFGIDGMCREMQPWSLPKRTSNSTSRNPGQFQNGVSFKFEASNSEKKS